MLTVTIPATIQEVVVELNQVGRLITAKHWERAAIVAAYVEVTTPGQPHSMAILRNSRRITPSAFAKYQIHGLRSNETITRYVRAWESTGRPVPIPGEVVILGDLPPWEQREAGITSAEGAVRSLPGIVSKILATDPHYTDKVLERHPDVIGALTDAMARGGYVVGLPDDSDPMVVAASMEADPAYADAIADALTTHTEAAANVAAKVLRTSEGQHAVARKMVEGTSSGLARVAAEINAASFRNSMAGKGYTQTRKTAEAIQETLLERVSRIGAIDMNTLFVLLPPMYAFDEFAAKAESVDYRVADEETRDTMREAARRLRANAQFLEDIADGRKPTRLSEDDLQKLLEG